MIKLKILSLFVGFAIMVISVSGQITQDSNCELLTHMFHYESLYSCKREGLKITTEANENHILKFKCSGTTQDQMNEIAKNYSLIRDKNWYFDVAWFESCPLTNLPFVEITSGSNQSTSLNIIRIEHSNLTDTFKPIHFKGFTGTKINFIFNNITLLPDDLFDKSSNIQVAVLFGNRIDLSTKAFTKLTKLVSLDLSMNDLLKIDENAFQNLYSLKRLNLWSNKIMSIHPKAFQDLIKLDTLELLNNDLQDLPEDIFSSLTSLKKVGLNKNKLTYLPRHLFFKTIFLEEVYICKNLLIKIPEKFFANLENLKIVLLSNNNLTSLPESWFSKSNSVERIDLQMNSLSTFNDRTFNSLKKLKSINLRNNRIQEFPVTLFHSLSQLNILDLSYNKIRKLDTILFEKLYNLKTLDLSYNALINIEYAFSPLQNLEELRLRFNNISFIGNNSVVKSPLNDNLNLRILDLSHNHITKIYMDWNFLVWLKKLDLSYNDIEYVDARDLYFVSADSIVDLSHNKIAFIDMRLSTIISSQQNMTWNDNYHPTRSVILGYNPLECNCNIYYFIKDIEESRYTKRVSLQVKDLQCVDPVLNGTYVTQISSQKITCEIEDCPSLCSCEFRIHDQTLLVSCDNQNLMEPPLLNSTLKYMSNSISNPFQVELNLTGNLLNEMPNVNEMFGSKIVNLTRLELSHNNISTIDAEDIHASLEILLLDHNKLTMLDDKTLNVLSNLTNLNFISLDHNPFECNCEITNLRQFVQNNLQKIENTSSPSCTPNGKHLARRSLVSITIEELCPTENDFLITIIISMVCVGAPLIILICLYFKFKEEIKLWLFIHEMCLWCFPKDYDMDKDKIYDAFISFSHKDNHFVIKDLIPALEECEPSFKLCVHYRDWIPGEFIPTQITNSVQSSRRTIIVLSKHFLESEWSKMEFRAAHKQSLTKSKNRVIVILYGEIGPTEKLDDELRTYLSINTYVKWGDPWFWEKLRYALPHYEIPINERQSEKFPRESFYENSTKVEDLA